MGEVQRSMVKAIAEVLNTHKVESLLMENVHTVVFSRVAATDDKNGPVDSVLINPEKKSSSTAGKPRVRLANKAVSRVVDGKEEISTVKAAVIKYANAAEKLTSQFKAGAWTAAFQQGFSERTGFSLVVEKEEPAEDETA